MKKVKKIKTMAPQKNAFGVFGSFEPLKHKAQAQTERGENISDKKLKTTMLRAFAIAVTDRESWFFE